MEIDKIRTALKPIVKRFSLELVVLYGSVAKKNTHSSSDLDIGVFASSPIDFDQLVLEMMKSLKRDDIDVADLRTAGPTLAFSIAKNGVSIFEKSSGRFGQFCSLAARKYYDAEKFRRARRELLKEYVKGQTHESH